MRLPATVQLSTDQRVELRKRLLGKFETTCSRLSIDASSIPESYLKMMTSTDPYIKGKLSALEYFGDRILYTNRALAILRRCPDLHTEIASVR